MTKTIRRKKAVIDLELPEELAFSLLKKELMGYRVLYLKEEKITTLIRIERMEADKTSGLLSANISQVELVDDKRKTEAMKWFKTATEDAESIFYDFTVDDELVNDSDTIHKMNGLLLMLLTAIDTAEFKVNKTYDTAIRIK